jgi:hypothetical protein
MEKVKGGRRVGKEYLSSGCLVVNSSSDVFFLIKTKENQTKKPLKGIEMQLPCEN